MSTSSANTPGRERGPNEVFCRNCGEIIDEKAEICPSCGVRQRAPPKSSVDSAVDDILQGGNPFVAAVLSALFPGLGQIYNRELERGLVFIVATIGAAISTLLFVGFILFPAVWLFSIYDAYTRAELRAEALRAEEHAHEVPVAPAVETDGPELIETESSAVAEGDTETGAETEEETGEVDEDAELEDEETDAASEREDETAT
ncbi:MULTISPECIES: zinc ribbon domain-containing protein [Haloferax]|uniref:Zinc ribbon domain-containing protein n=2 Tax=Haloferax TaxID=2251 RepID=A0A6G1YYK3_9EURY|nr:MULTISPECIES: zinc ribbon domain-containing protein [Haloferax]KAB1186605.1 zinc ribbon domain-containing protein [Haloferax sp. CBA1149]MRW79221.1 zinc ribbon domain-containing protein [Haloferax marinisediminis]